jgi:hypothetical protein
VTKSDNLYTSRACGLESFVSIESIDMTIAISKRNGKDLTGWTEDPRPAKPPMKRGGKIPRKRFYADDFPAPRSLCQIAKDLGTTWESLHRSLQDRANPKWDRIKKSSGENHMKIGICNELFQGWPIEGVFEYAGQLGYDGVEIAPYTLADSVIDISRSRRRAIQRSAEKNRIEIVGLHWLLVKPEGLSINHPDEITRIRTQEYMEALIHFCADIGSSVTRLPGSIVHYQPHLLEALVGHFERHLQEGYPKDDCKLIGQSCTICKKKYILEIK